MDTDLDEMIKDEKEVYLEGKTIIVN